MIEAMSLNGIYSLSYLCLEFSNILSIIIEFLSRRFFYTHTAFLLRLVASTCFAVLTMSIIYFRELYLTLTDSLYACYLWMWDMAEMLKFLRKRIIPKFVMRVGSCGIESIYGIWGKMKNLCLYLWDFASFFIHL